MTTEIAKLTPKNEASAPVLPASLRQALNDYNPAYGLPVGQAPPSVSDCRAGIAALELGLVPATRQEISACVAKLVVGFNMQQSKDEARMRLEVWVEANGDLPADLWQKGTKAVLQSYTYGMPKPSNLRELVQEDFDQRRAHLRAARALLDMDRKSQQVVREPYDVRIRGLRDSWRRVGKLGRAAGYERELAALENRAVEAWAMEIHAEPEVADRPEPPPYNPDARPFAAELREMAEEFRRKQRAEIDALNAKDGA